MSSKNHWIPILRNALRESEAVPLELTKVSLRFILVEIMTKTKVSYPERETRKKEGNYKADVGKHTGPTSINSRQRLSPALPPCIMSPTRRLTTWSGVSAGPLHPRTEQARQSRSIKPWDISWAESLLLFARRVLALSWAFSALLLLPQRVLALSYASRSRPLVVLPGAAPSGVKGDFPAQLGLPVVVAMLWVKGGVLGQLVPLWLATLYVVMPCVVRHGLLGRLVPAADS